MELVIIKLDQLKINYKAFAEFLIPKIQEKLISLFDPSKTIKLTNYINNNSIIQFTNNKYKKYLTVRDILIGAVYNSEILDNKLNTVIQINKQAIIPDTYNDYYNLVKLINYGNLGVYPYKIWDDTLDWINNHLGIYLEEFLEG